MSVSERIREIARVLGRFAEESSRSLVVIADELDAAEVKPKWFWGRPNQNGLWLFGDIFRDAPRTLYDVSPVRSFRDCKDGWWAYHSPLPTIDPPDKPKQYRSPEIADMGKQCEFSNDGFKTFIVGNLQAYDMRLMDKWVMEFQCGYSDCRIEVTE